jgi:hypothetical protein
LIFCSLFYPFHTCEAVPCAIDVIHNAQSHVGYYDPIPGLDIADYATAPERQIMGMKDWNQRMQGRVDVLLDK